MGGNQSHQQSYIRNSNCQCGCVDEKRPCKYKTSDYGSWTNLANQTSSPTRTDAVSSDSEHSSERSVGLPGDVQPISSSTLLLTQPPSLAQDCLIRRAVPKLLDVGPDVVQHQKRNLSTSPVSSPINSALEALTPGNAALHFCLITTPELSPSEAQSRKKIIARSFLEHMEALMDQVQPDEVAEKLYGIGVLNIDELRCASDMQEEVDDRARELVRLLKRKLWLSPEWFVDICKILRNCGVKVIAQVIDEVYNACPTEEMSILSTGRSFSCSTSTVRSSLRKSSLPSCHDMIMKIEDSFKENGLQAATELLQKYTAEQGGDLQLIHKACQCGIEVSTLDLLLDILDLAGDNHITDSKDECGRTPLHEACAALKPRSAADDEDADALEGNAEQRLKIERLITHGANYCSRDKDGNTALHLAVLRSDCEAVSVLLRSGKRCINIVNKRGNTALHLAARRGQVDIVKVLCHNRANTSTQNNKSLTALHLTCIHNHIDAAMELASHDQSTLDAFNKYHMTPLHICCKKGHALLALALLRLKNCSTFKLDKDNKTPLHYAVSGGNVSLVTSLLQKDELSTGGESKGLMVDAQDQYGDTALHIAGRLGNKPIAKQLLNFRANKDILNQEGKNPLEVAIECEHDMVAAKLIRKRGWYQHRKTMKKVYKLRRTLTQSTLTSTFQSEVSDSADVMSSESEDDENVGSGERRRSTP